MSPQPGRQLTSDQVHPVWQLVHRRSQPGIDQHDPVLGADHKAADRQEGGVIPVEQPVVRPGLRAEVLRPDDERPVRDGVEVKVSDPHRCQPMPSGERDDIDRITDMGG